MQHSVEPFRAVDVNGDTASDSFTVFQGSATAGSVCFHRGFSLAERSVIFSVAFAG